MRFGKRESKSRFACKIGVSLVSPPVSSFGKRGNFFALIRFPILSPSGAFSARNFLALSRTLDISHPPLNGWPPGSTGFLFFVVHPAFGFHPFQGCSYLRGLLVIREQFVNLREGHT